MFNIGDYVVNAKNGICEIKDIMMMNMTGKAKQYYMLVPLEEKNAKIYIPVDKAEERIRPVMEKEEAWELIGEIKTIDVIFIENERERERIFKEAINSCEPKQLVSIIKSLYLRRQKRFEEGKKSTEMDERYFKLAQNHLYGELAFALEVSKSEMYRIIEENI